MNEISEFTIVRNAYRRLSKKGSVTVRCDVPLLGRCIDLAYMCENSLFSVEFKLHDWRRAIRQAYDHKLGADFAYICMPKRNVTEDMRNEFNRAGVGLVFYRAKGDWPFETVIEAPKSKDTWSVARSNLRRYISEHESKKTFSRQTH